MHEPRWTSLREQAGVRYLSLFTTQVYTCVGAAAQQPSTEEVVTLPGHSRGLWVVIGLAQLR